MSAQPVDVLAVMDTVAEHTFQGRAVALREARAAVAETDRAGRQGRGA
jgi:hypothetical protein